MINREFINPEAQELEYLISLGIKGNHILFKNERIREAFGKDLGKLAAAGKLDVDEINRVVKEIISIQGLEEKKLYIESLPLEMQDVLIILYFQLIDKNLMSGHKILH